MDERSRRVDWSSLKSADWKTNPPILELKYPDGKTKYILAVPYQTNGKNKCPDLNLYSMKDGVVFCIPQVPLAVLQKGEITCLECNKSITIGIEFIGFVNDLKQKNEIWPALQIQTPLDRLHSLV